MSHISEQDPRRGIVFSPPVDALHVLLDLPAFGTWPQDPSADAPASHCPSRWHGLLFWAGFRCSERMFIGGALWTKTWCQRVVCGIIA